MPRKPEMTVWAAVITGLDACQQSDTPLASLGEFLQKLSIKGWHIADVQTVERCVLELLRCKREQEMCDRKETAACSSPNQVGVSKSEPDGVTRPVGVPGLAVKWMPMSTQAFHC
jgi:hypothetical protein